MYLQTFLVLFGFFFIVFIIGQVVKDNSIVDIAWGAGFVISALYNYFANPDVGIKGIVVSGAIVIWGSRLTYYIGKRNIGKPEDFRYVDMRKRWGTKWVLIKAFLNVYFLQLAIQYVVTLPVIYGNATDQGLKWFNFVGIGIWAIGFFFESVGDYQLKTFKKNPENKGKLMDKGLWSLTRHPNYFGNATMWWGVFFIAITNFSSVWVAVGPALMTFFLYFVSGVKMLEKKYVGRADYAAYKQRTNAFIPWLPKKV